MTPKLKTLLTTLVCLTGVTLAQAGASSPAPPSSNPPRASIGDFSGTYTFLRDGEDLQINVRNGKLDGYVTRFGDSDMDDPLLLQHFFSKASLVGNDVAFTTEKLHGVWFEFKGKVQRGGAKTTAEEGYYQLVGTLIRYDATSADKATARSRQVTFHSHASDFGVILTDPKKKGPP